MRWAKPYIGKGVERPSIANQCGTKQVGKPRFEEWKNAYGRYGMRTDKTGNNGLARKPREGGWWPETREPAGCLGGRPASQLAPATGSPPFGPCRGWVVLADFGHFFGVVRGPIFNPKDAGTQVRYNTKQTKQIWGKTGLRFDRSEFSKFNRWKWPKKCEWRPKNGTEVLFLAKSQSKLYGIIFLWFSSSYDCATPVWSS